MLKTFANGVVHFKIVKYCLPHRLNTSIVFYFINLGRGTTVPRELRSMLGPSKSLDRTATAKIDLIHFSCSDKLNITTVT